MHKRDGHHLKTFPDASQERLCMALAPNQFKDFWRDCFPCHATIQRSRRGFFHPRRCSDPLWRLPRLTDGAGGRFSKAGLRLSTGCESFSATLLQAMTPL